MSPTSLKKTVIFLFAMITCLSLGASSHAYLVNPSGYSFSRPGDYGYIASYGIYSYTDPDKIKLTDGIIGQDDWTQNEDYKNWVGWWGISYQGDLDGDKKVSMGDYIDNPVTITFNFAQDFKLSAINLWTNQDAIHTFNVVYPGEISISRKGEQLVSLTSAFSKGRSGTDNEYNNGKLHEISFDLGDLDIASGDEISITLSNYNIFSQLVYNEETGNWEYDGIPWNNNAGSEYNGMFWIFLSEVEFVSANPVPVPGSMLLLGSGLLFLVGVTRRKRRS